MSAFFRDIRYAVRGLRKAPGFTAVAVVTLALGVGANTAIFSVVQGVVLRPLPYANPDRIVQVWREQSTTNAWFRIIAEDINAFADISGFTNWGGTLTNAGEPEELPGAVVSPSHFTVLGVPPALGRSFRPEDGVPGRAPVVILSHGLWRRRFGSDAGIVGESIRVGGVPREVVGVMPSHHRPLERGWQLWVPLVIDPERDVGDEGPANLEMIARLEAGVTMGQATAEVRGLAARLQQLSTRITDENVRRAGVIPLHDALVGDVRTTLWLLLGAVGLVLLIACGNVANLLLARSGARERELSIRTALGAGRGRVFRQLFTESAVLGVLGGVAGLVVATLVVSILSGSLPADMPRGDEIGIDLGVLSFAFGVSLLAGLVFGLAPALRSTRDDVQHVLRGAGRSAMVGVQRHRLNGVLVAAEIALSVVLVVGGGLTMKSLWRLQQVDPGFNPERVLSARVIIPGNEYPSRQERAMFFEQVIDRITAIPGVRAGGGIDILPLTSRRNGYRVYADDNPVPAGNTPSIQLRVTSGDYFQAMGIPLLAGRLFQETDLADAPQVGLINEAMARQFWPGQDPMGKEIRVYSEDGPAFRVVGVVGNTHHFGLDREAQPQMFRPFRQWGWTRLTLTVRAGGDAAALTPAIRRALWEVDDDVPLSEVSVLERVVWNSTAGSRLFTILLSAFGVLSLVLAAVGVYGVMSYTVSERTHEFGIRLAMGATNQNVIRSAIGRAVTPVALGIGAGLVAAFATTRVLSSQLFGVSTTDPIIFGVVPLVLALVAVFASYIPARRAVRVDPMIALRAE